jgi:hypothetical protein
MSAAHADLVSYLQHLAPTWRKTQQEGFARLLAALLERPTLCLTELARAFPRPAQPLPAADHPVHDHGDLAAHRAGVPRRDRGRGAGPRGIVRRCSARRDARRYV